MIIGLILVAMLLIILMCGVYLLAYGNDYTYTDSNGISWYCYVGSDYVICDEIGDGVGYN